VGRQLIRAVYGYVRGGSLLEFRLQAAEDRLKPELQQKATVQAIVNRSSRVLRGGSFNNQPRNLRSANRNNNRPSNRNNTVGLRVASTPRRTVRPPGRNPGANDLPERAGVRSPGRRPVPGRSRAVPAKGNACPAGLVGQTARRPRRVTYPHLPQSLLLCHCLPLASEKTPSPDAEGLWRKACSRCHLASGSPWPRKWLTFQPPLTPGRATTRRASSSRWSGETIPVPATQTGRRSITPVSWLSAWDNA
jgi:Sulfatase-modifying factor enzyme 1